MRTSVRIIVISALLTWAAGLSIPSLAQNPNPPEVMDLSKASFQIVDATYVTKLEGSGNIFNETNPDKYHGLIVTVRITKQAGAELTVACQDIALHYRYGLNSDIARCYGLSSFSVQQKEDRPMSLYKEGWGRSTTGIAATQIGTVYIDVFFQHMEPNTSDLYLFIAQPTGAHFISQG
jgi:hypothetical protein